MTDRCAKCGHPRAEHSYNGACYGLCGEFVEAPRFEVRSESVVWLIDSLRSEEGDSVTILCDNPDFNGQPNCAIVCNGGWTDWQDRRFAADTVLDALSMAMTEKKLPAPRKVIAESNGHHWVERFHLVCCRDCGMVRRADDQNKPCKGVIHVSTRDAAQEAWSCGAMKQGAPGGNDPADCDWPMCGCDPKAGAVLAALEDQGIILEKNASPSPFDRDVLAQKIWDADGPRYTGWPSDGYRVSFAHREQYPSEWNRCLHIADAILEIKDGTYVR